MALESYCAACTYMGEREDCGKYWCEKKGEDRYANDARCSSFCEAYSRSDYSRKNMYEVSASASSSGCYLTTMMCQLLGFEDDNYYLNKLRYFRDNVMKKSGEYIPLLIVYDVVGPIISKKLANDEYGEVIAKVYFDEYITKAVHAIEEEKNKEAINVYIAMTDSLAKRYGIDTTFVRPDIKDIDMQSLGHARRRKPNYGV